MPNNRHPRFPDRMSLEIREAIGDELDITLAGFPMQRQMSKPHALTCYAEHLDGYTESDIRKGFELARQRSTQFAPSAGVVRSCIGEACTARLHATVAESRRTSEEAPFVSPTEIPNWREQLGVIVGSIGNGPNCGPRKLEVKR